MLRFSFLLTVLVAGLWPVAQGQTYINEQATPSDTTWTGPVSSATFWNQITPKYGQVIKTPNARDTMLTAFAFYGSVLLPGSSPTFKAVVYEFDTTTKITTLPPVFDGPLAPMPTLPSQGGGSYGVITPTLPAPGVPLDPTKTYLISVQAETLNVTAGFFLALKDPPTYVPSGACFSKKTDADGAPWTGFTPVSNLLFWATFDAGTPPTPPCDPTGITLTGKTSRSSVRVSSTAKTAGRGPTVRYTVTLANTNKRNKTTAAQAFGNAGLVVQLPANTSYVKASVQPRASIAGATHNKTLATAVYDVQAHTVTWPDAPLAAGKRRKYTVLAKVFSTATSPLVFQATCPNCPQLTTQSSVTVVSK